MTDAPELIEEAASQPTYDELMRRDPKTITKAERRMMIEHERNERALWQAKEKAKEDKKYEEKAA